MSCKPEIDIIIPTYNQSSYTAACAASLAKHTPPERARVIWVDNGSNPAERELIEEAWAKGPLVVLPFYLPENLGFVKATNIGIAASTAPYVLLLNNDTELPEHWSEKMIDVMAHNPEVGAVGTRSTSRAQWQGVLAHEPGATAVPANVTLAFFCTLIRRAVIEKVGYLSEEYRIGLCDDDDYVQRMTQAGWRCAVRTDLLVLHHHRSTFCAIYGDGGWLPYQKENTAYFKTKWGLPA